MSDMSPAIVPKSDQLNADDLLTGPITVKITGVTVRGGQEQPVAISYEGDNGKPYKPCKSMCRVMVSAWGADSSKYVGRSMTLYCDTKVKWAGMEVGGIRISHMSDIDSEMTMALTVTRANKKPFKVRPLPTKRTTQNPAPSQACQSPPSPVGEPADGAELEICPECKHSNALNEEIVHAPNCARKKLSDAGSMGALAKAWSEIGTDARARLEAFKDECKARIMKADKEAVT